MSAADTPTAIVTGASSGIGLQATAALVKRGWHVVMACRDLGKAGDALRRIGLEAGSVTPMHLDLASLDSVRRFVENYRRRADALEALVCNAAVYLPQLSQPMRSRDVDFIDGMKWGLTFLINPQPLDTGRSANSLAWAGLMNSYYWIDPAKGITGVFATQILPFCDVKALPLFWDFERAVYDAVG